MFTLSTKQKIFQIGNFRVGGQPGELPTLLIGNIFYKGMPEVLDHKKGIFDKMSVSKWIKSAETFSEKNGVPHCLDIMAMYPDAISNYIEFVIEQTSAPFFIDGANLETRKAGLETIKQLKLENRVIFNGITPRTSMEELAAIRDSGVNIAVLMAFNELDYSSEGRISILQGSIGKKGLFDMGKEAGIMSALIDTIVFDVPSISYAAEAIFLVKKKLGYPSGCSPANATYAWRQAKKGSDLIGNFAASNAAAHSIVQYRGADFLIYGPIKQAKSMISACAINDAIIAYHAMKHFGVKPLVRNHPLYRIF
ncbi:MAG: hypothetical protein JSV05_04710 [Candidatus Bathyarchaeota archaeon]|nr:MAG: hypothetical protein JSV05_04710 [Candidatus Bathyarchaeota archaeon]